MTDGDDAGNHLDVRTFGGPGLSERHVDLGYTDRNQRRKGVGNECH
jgi:hypothetical protein